MDKKLLKETTITLALIYEGKEAIIDRSARQRIKDAVNSAIDEKGMRCSIKTWRDDVVIFRRGIKSPKFTDDQVRFIEAEKLSIRKKAMKYNTSTRTIQKIMNGEYLGKESGARPTVLNINVTKDEKELIQAHAAACSESLNAFVTRAIKETIERDKPTEAR